MQTMQVAAEIKEAGGEAISVPGDVTAEDFAPKIIKATIEKFGALHILGNNAGQKCNFAKSLHCPNSNLFR